METTNGTLAVLDTYISVSLSLGEHKHIERLSSRTATDFKEYVITFIMRDSLSKQSLTDFNYFTTFIIRILFGPQTHENVDKQSNYPYKTNSLPMQPNRLHYIPRHVSL